MPRRALGIKLKQEHALAIYFRRLGKLKKKDEVGGQGEIAPAKAIDPNIAKRSLITLVLCGA